MEGYSHDEPFDEGYLQASELHKVYYSQYGEPDGKPGERLLHNDQQRPFATKMLKRNSNIPSRWTRWRYQQGKYEVL